MEKCNEHDIGGGDGGTPNEQPSEDSLKTGFIPYVGNKRDVTMKLPHIFDIRSKLRKDRLQKKLKDM